MYKKLQSRNGLTTIVSTMPQMSSVSIGVWIGVGGRYETKTNSGISHLLEHMLFKGTYTRNTKQLKQSIEGVGGVFNGFTSDEVTCYMVKVPSKFMELGIDILTDMVLNAKLDINDLEREKHVVCEEIKMYKDQPSDHVVDILEEIMWPNNALGRPLTGSISNVKKIKISDLEKFKQKWYTPSNITVVATGKVNYKKAFKYSSEKFNNLKKESLTGYTPPQVFQKRPRMKIVKGITNQTHIAMGFHDPAKNSRQRFATKMMNVILGGNMSSRLFEELREKHGLCYDVSSAYKRHSDVGEVQIHSGVDCRNTVKAVVAIFDELKKLKDIGVTEGELSRAKKYAKGQFLLAMEGTSTRMMWLGDRMMTYNEIPKLKDVLKKIDAVTSKEIQSVCENIFKPSSMNIAMIGKVKDKDKKKINEEIKKI